MKHKSPAIVRANTNSGEATNACVFGLPSARLGVEIEEIHHIHKLDHPSGTAITLAEDIIGQLDAKHSWSENMPVTDDSIHITARREGEIPGTHTIVYDSAVDTIRITHEAKNRKGFALGDVVAAEFTVGKKGFLTMQDLFSFLK